MKCKIKFLFLFCFFITGCKKNLALFMESQKDYVGENFINMPTEELEERSFNDSYFELTWGHAFPINYFNYSQKNTSLFLHQYGDNNEFDIMNLKIIVKELKYSHVFTVNNDMKIERTNSMYFISLQNCMSEILNNQEDLLNFDKIDFITIIVTISDSNIEKELTFRFIPVLEKSNRIIDKLMSI